MRKIKTIALIAPSGSLREIDYINNNIKILQEKFRIKKYYNENSSVRYLSDSDENRVKFFEQAFLDDEIDAVLSIRGGFGALRIVDMINWDIIKDSNKIYLGSSDATILSIALIKKTSIKCFYSLMITNGFVENLDRNIEIIENNIFKLNLKILKEGSAKGYLWGGNLSSIVSMLSDNRYLPDKDIILFLEDLNEPMYKIDKMLYEIYRSKKLKERIKGIIFGDFYFKEHEIMPLLREYSEIFNVPTKTTQEITHKINNITIPLDYLIDFQQL